ncbi:HAD-IIA family hydrolase [Iamia sp.]|uniref:HAD-IIA family hydrolase n=1 Tax=Iamia sp. TaxID=2722710 RepID=UPI002D099DAE|nr:HAD-IIA family hydrolase [Iamia sp.]HXH59069.1 HAD-IIA family hydrolase [Iamia sp.]
MDLDGVMWLGSAPIPGPTDAVARLRAAGHPVVFVTNNSSLPVAVVEAQLAAQGVEAKGAVMTSAGAVATLVGPGERVLVCGGEGLVEAVAGRGAETVVNAGTDPGPVDAVVCGFWRAVDYERLRWAVTSVHRGARLLASNDDATYPSAEGLLPGGGATLAAVERAGGVVATVAGKPHAPMAQWLRDAFGPNGVMAGDRPDTDGRFARALGWRFTLVLSGVSPTGDGADPAPDEIAADLSEAVERALGPPP